MRAYFDHQSATPLLPEARAAMAPFLEADFGNPSSLHSEGIRARDALAQAREKFAAFLGARSVEEIIFTGNGAEALNLAIKGTAWAQQGRGNHIILSAAEHPAVAEPVRWLARRGFECTVVSVAPDGTVAPEALKESLRDETILVCVHQANHDIGTLQPVAAIGDITSERGIPLLVDARATAGWMPCNVSELRADLLVISPSHFYGPKGVGVLYRSRRAPLEPLVHGGEQEDGYRAGTENIPAIVGAAVAAEIAQRDLPDRSAHARSLQMHAFDRIRGAISGARLLGPEPGSRRHPAHLSFAFENVESEALGLMLDVKGIAVATGSACVTREKRVPPVLAAIGLPEAFARGNVILSFGKDNTLAEIDFLVETLARAVPALREMSFEQQ